MPAPIDAAAAIAEDRGAPGYRYSLGLLTLIYLVNLVDRQVVTIVAEPIRREFGLSDWQLGAMTGLSFAILYTVAGFPIARLAERGNRARIIAASVAVWSVFTALCGVAQGFAQFVLARIGVGLGEAGCTPPAHSLIADIAPRARRASALAIYSLGGPLGALVGMAMGGIVAATWGWRAVFLIAGLPGVVLALVALLTLSEPRVARRSTVAPEPAIPFGVTLRTLLTNRSFLLVAAGTAGAAFAFYGLSAFYASFYLRNHADDLTAAGLRFGLQPIAFLGLALGLSGGVAGVIGAVFGGRATDAWAARNPAAHVLMPAVCTAAAAPILTTAVLADDLWVSIVLVAAGGALNSAWVGGVYAAALGLSPAQARATTSALLLFVMNLVGLGLGPLTVGLFSDAFAPSLGAGAGLRWGMVCAALAGLVGTACFWAARTSLARQTIG